MNSKKEIICGVDEAGRGPLAGEVVAGAVVLGDNKIDGLNDSKKLTKARRDKLSILIRKKAVAFGIGIATVEEIDKFNIREATILAMQRAVIDMSFDPTKILVDGNFCPEFDYPAEFLIRGDTISQEIMAASILAKTTRDQMMIDFHEKYPEYGFIRHKGYGTAEHLNAIAHHGPCSIHRKTFAPIKDFYTSGILTD